MEDRRGKYGLVSGQFCYFAGANRLAASFSYHAINSLGRGRSWSAIKIWCGGGMFIPKSAMLECVIPNKRRQ